MPAPLVEIIAQLRRQLDAGAARVELLVADPDRGRGSFAGEPIELGDGVVEVHRPLRVWVELADRLELRLATPVHRDDGRIALTFERLERRADRREWTDAATGDAREKYGATSSYARITKAEDPGFVLDLGDALARARLPLAPAILDLGCNDGEVCELIGRLLGPQSTPRFVGVDHSRSAVHAARERFAPAPAAHRFLEADLHALTPLALGRFDLVLALNTLHSPGVDENALLRQIVADLLSPRGAVILGLPNCSYRDGELLHGARTRNISQPELSLLVKRAAYYRRYLQQHGRRVFVTGNNYVLVTGVAQRPAAS